MKNSLSEMAKSGMIFKKGTGEYAAECEFDFILISLQENAEKIIRQVVARAKEEGSSINAYAVKAVIKEIL